MMKALVWEAPRQLALRDRPIPEPAAGELLLQVAYAGICGSELGGYLGLNALRIPPLVMGHELSAIVVKLGEGVAAPGPGTQVTVNPLLSCGACSACTRGLEQLCPQRKLIGAGRPGAYAGYVTVPASACHPLPAGLDLRQGALTEPVACAVRITRLAGSRVSLAGEPLLISGAGPIGLLALQTLKAAGAGPIFVTDLHPARRAMVAALGGEPLDPTLTDVVAIVKEATGGMGAVATVDAVGVAATRGQCISATRAGGTVIFTGLHEEVGNVPAADIIRREIVVQGSFAYSHDDFAVALAELGARRIGLAPWIVEAPLADGGLWFERLLGDPGPVAKVLLVPG